MEHKENAGKRRLIFLNTKIASNGEDMKAMVDTGSEISIVHVQHVANLKYNFQNRSRIVSASGHRVDTLGSVELKLKIMSHEFVAECQVVNFNVPHKLILGMNFLEAHQAIINLQNQTVTLEKRMLSVNVVRCSKDEPTVSYISWKRDDELGPPPIVVRTAEYCRIGEREREE